MNLKVFRYNESMLNECIDVYRKTFSRAPWFDKDERSEVERYFKSFYKSNRFLGYVICDDKKIIGLSLGFVKPWIRGEEYFVDQFCVDFAFQGKGVGSFFLQKIKEDLRRNHVNAIILVTEKEFNSYNFYIRNGFQTSDTQRIMGIGL